MAKVERVRRIVQLRLRTPAPDITQLTSFVNAAMPFYRVFGCTQVRLLQNVDDPAKFVQIIEYETEASLEQSRQRVASDPVVQGYLQAWRSLFPGAVEVDVYQEVASES